MNPVYSVDYESFYNSKEGVDISTLGAANYVRATPEIYLVSIHGPGVSFAGHPSDAPWGHIEGKTWVSHNAAFDILVHEEAIRRHLVPLTRPLEWHCTANLAAYNQGERSLQKAALKLLQVPVSKDYRAVMNGRLFSSLSAAERHQVVTAGQQDAEVSYSLAERFLPGWPAMERDLSRLTIDSCHRGIPVDQEYAKECVEKLTAAKEAAKRGVPWAEESSDKGVLSLNAAAAHCRSLGLPAPASFAEDSEECVAWEAEYGARHKFVAALRDYRRTNILLRRINRVLAGTLDGFYRYSLLYFGAHTGRWAGAGGFNVQNMNRDSAYGVELRRIFRAPEGHTLIIRDLSNIENRCLAWAAGQHELLDLIRRGMSPYEAFARTIKLWDAPGDLKSGDKTLYAIAKAMVLGLGYGCGPKKFPTVAQIMGGDGAMQFLRDRAEQLRQESRAMVDLGDGIPTERYLLSSTAAEEEASREIVTTFREKNPEVVGLWNFFDEQLRDRVGSGFRMQLPSGREIQYSGIHWRDIRNEETGKVSRRLHATTDGFTPRSFWGGTLTENYIQAFARDIFGTGLLRYEESRDHDSPLLFHAHDEAIVMCPLGKEERTHKLLDSALTAPISFCPDLPLKSEGVTSPHYVK